MTVGVYSIIAPDGRQYIGQSRTIEERFGFHRKNLNRGTHHNLKLQDAWNNTRGFPDHATLWRWAILVKLPADVLQNVLDTYERAMISQADRWLGTFNTVHSRRFVGDEDAAVRPKAC